jgi:hypothetical protein
MDSRDFKDLLAEKLLRRGMPCHCGLCKRFISCSKVDPDKVCVWLKKNQRILKRFFFICFLAVFACFIFYGKSCAQVILRVIGPQGGEVVSPDNKVKLVVPEGALSADTSISISTISSDSMQAGVPDDTILLNLVECLPQGLVFNKPVQIVYTLSSSEIPGTPIQLGLYDSVSKQIVPTNEISRVEADGLTVRAFIDHFSIYAALKNLVSQGTPIGGGVKIPLPDMLTGAYGHSIPITIPPGRKGMQPFLGLSYRSSNGNSVLGLGFSMNPGYIVRSTRLGPPTYSDTTDTFYFISDAGTTELVRLIDNLYQAKIESGFTKFYKEADDSWKAVAKDGNVLRFGQGIDSKEISSLGTFAWYLTRAVDTNGNDIAITYAQDQGKSYLSRIDYTGNEDTGFVPTHSVEFIYESRLDAASSYISTSKIITAKRLKEIIVKANNELVWRYALEYTYSPDTNRSLLTSVTQYAADNKNLPIQRFSYQKSSD